MATIYRFIVENKQSGSSGRNNTSTNAPKKTTGKSKLFSIGGERGGVEHNRKMRALNPLFNKATHGYHEKGMRIGRAGIGLMSDLQSSGLKGLLGVGGTIIGAFVIQTLLKVQRKQSVEADKQNTQNFKSMETGISAIHGEYRIARNYWSGKIDYNENK